MSRTMKSHDTWEPVRDALGRFVAGFGRSLSGKSRENRDEIRTQREALRELDDRPLGPHASSYGVDSNGNDMPYLSDRPNYGPNQVDDVWNASRQRQLDEWDFEDMGLATPGDNQMWVETNVDGEFELVTWNPGDSRTQVWDMGHLPGLEYHRLHDQFMTGQIDYDTFIARYRDAARYSVQHWLRNQSHVDEL